MYEETRKTRKDDPHAKSVRHLRRVDPVMKRIIADVGPCGLRPSRRYFYSLCEAIVAQQLAVKAAATIFGRFRGLFPRKTPTPAEVSALSDAEFQSVGISQQKRGYLRDLAEKFGNNRIPHGRFARMADEEIIAALTEVKGVGEWTAQMFLIFVLCRPDVWPTGDLGIRRAVQIKYGLAEMPADGKLVEVAEPWRPFRSVASWYLWASLDNKPM